MLPVAVDIVVAGVFALIAVALTIWAYRGDARAAHWGARVSRGFGLVIFVLFFDPFYRFATPIEHLEGVLATAPQEPVGASAEAIHALVQALRITNWVPLLVAVVAGFYMVETLPKIVTEQRTKANPKDMSSTTM